MKIRCQILCLVWTFVSIGIYHHAMSQDVTAELTKRPKSERHEFFSPAPVVPVDNQYSSMLPDGSFELLDLVVPEKEAEGEHGIVELYFTGGTGRKTLVLVCDYKSPSPRFYVDHNQNWDFTDDGDSLALEKNDFLDIHLHNAQSEDAVTVFRLQRLAIPNDKVRNNWKRNIKRKPKFANADLPEPDYWFRELQFNIRSADVEIDRLRFQIGLMDWNCNGLYNDNDDRLLLGEFQSDQMSSDLNDNSYLVGESSLFAVGDKGFKIVSIAETGSSLSFQAIDRSEVPSKLKVGQKLPEIAVKSLSDESVLLNDSLVAGKYNYIEFWGTWCKGCVEELPRIREAVELHEEKLNVIGLHYGDDPIEELKSFLKKNKVTWQQSLATEDAIDTLRVSGFPYGILIDPDGSIAAFNIRIEKVIERIK